MDEVQSLLQSAVEAITGETISVELTVPEEQFGDYATNVALKLSKKLGQNPREIAEKIAAELKNSSAISDVVVAGPGFINVKLTDEALFSEAARKPVQSLKGKTVVAEYSDPNPFKVLHAGHLYTTIAGDAIASLLENAGAEVHRLNYGGDVGRHVGITMWAIIQFLGGEFPEKLQTVPEADRLEWLSARYVEGTAAFEDSQKTQQEVLAINKRVYGLHESNDHESPFAQIYWTTRQWSYDGFDSLYEKLGVELFTYVPESEVAPLGLKMVETGKQKGIFEESDGAIIFRGEKHDLHTRVFINSEGLPTYEAKELGLATKKWQDYHFDLSVIITANDITEYMKVVLAALNGLYPEVVPRTKHLTHGVVKLPGGVKMSSRKGNILRATDILDEAHKANKEARGGEDNHDTVLGAVKYAFLKQRIGGDIIYDPEESVSLHGNSGPYLQYAHARARSILTKATKQPATNSRDLETDERSLLRKLSEYTSVVEQATAELMPHHICTYLYELAQVFNRFYERSRVIGDEREAVRLQLVKLYANSLKSGLELLNIPALEKM